MSRLFGLLPPRVSLQSLFTPVFSSFMTKLLFIVSFVSLCVDVCLWIIYGVIASALPLWVLYLCVFCLSWWLSQHCASILFCFVPLWGDFVFVLVFFTSLWSFLHRLLSSVHVVIVILCFFVVNFASPLSVFICKCLHSLVIHCLFMVSSYHCSHFIVT